MSVVQTLKLMVAHEAHSAVPAGTVIKDELVEKETAAAQQAPEPPTPKPVGENEAAAPQQVVEAPKPKAKSARTSEPYASQHKIVFGLAKQLQMTLSTARSICKQSKLKDKDWAWAVDEAAPLNTAVENLKEIKERCEEFITKTIIRGLGEHGSDKDKYLKALNTFETQLVQATQSLCEFLRPLQGMHAEKFKPVQTQPVPRGKKRK